MRDERWFCPAKEEEIVWDSVGSIALLSLVVQRTLS